MAHIGFNGWRNPNSRVLGFEGLRVYGVKVEGVRIQGLRLEVLGLRI